MCEGRCGTPARKRLPAWIGKLEKRASQGVGFKGLRFEGLGFKGLGLGLRV